MQSLYNFQRLNGSKDRKVRSQISTTACKRYLSPHILYKSPKQPHQKAVYILKETSLPYRILRVIRLASNSERYELFMNLFHISLYSFSWPTVVGRLFDSCGTTDRQVSNSCPTTVGQENTQMEIKNRSKKILNSL